MIRRTSILLALLASVTCLTAADRPNIVFILADDMGYGDAGCYNPKSKIPTPNLDRLASQGMRFTDAHAPASVCSPTRYALLTGRYAWRSPLKHDVVRPWDQPIISENRLTVASLLKQNGYTTAAIGKWHLGWNWPTKDGAPAASGTDRLSNVDFSQPIANGPIARGFDSYFGVDVPNYPPYCFIENDRTVGIPSVPDAGRGEHFNIPGPMLPGWCLVDVLPELTRHTVKWIGSAAKAKQPFFLYLPLTSPHYPVVPAPEFKGKSQAGDYGDFIVQTDAVVGEVLAALDQAGVVDNTLVIFTSDNGPEITGEVDPGAYDRLRDFQHDSMGGLRGAKRDLWEAGHRVPFLARWPGRVPVGAVSDEVICHVDFMATAAAMLGVALPQDSGEDSFSILPVLLGEKSAKPAREATVHHSCSGKFAIRKGDWVLIEAPSGDDNGRRGEPQWLKKMRADTEEPMSGALYDLREDPAQRKNHFAAQPERVRKLHDLLAKYQRDGRSTPGASKSNDPPHERFAASLKTAPQPTPAAYDPSVPKPTLSEVRYGPHQRNMLDFWKAESDQPTPWVLVIHGGSWTSRSKEFVKTFVEVPDLLKAGISVVAINYRYVSQAKSEGMTPPVKGPMDDCARALQFVRSKAAEWNLDQSRVGAAGGSAGACSGLWLAFHDDLANPKSEDPVVRESSRLFCAAVKMAQTSLDPKQMEEWTPNSKYGAHAFGLESFGEFLASREKILPWIREYSPYELVSAGDPPIYLFYPTPPAMGQNEKDPTHTANFGVKLQEHCLGNKVPCELVYPGAPDVKHAAPTDYFIEVLKGK